MKKVLIILFCLFLSVGMIQPMDALAANGDTVYGTLSGLKNAVTWCNKLSQKDLDKYANEIWKGNTTEFYEKYNYYADPRRSTQRGCQTNAIDMVNAVRVKCSNECKKVGCDTKGNCASGGGSQKAQQQCKRCNSVFNTLYAQYKSDMEAGKEAACERDVALGNGVKALGAAAVGATTGAAVGSVATPIGTVFGAIGGGVAGFAASVFSSDSGTAVYSFVLTNFLKFKEGCWFCPIYSTIYNTGNKLATSLYDKLRDIALALLAIFAFGWTLFQVAKFVTTLHAPNVGEFLTRIFKTLGTVAIMAAFLAPSISFLTGYFIDVPSLTALNITDEILQAGGFGGDEITYSTFTEAEKCTEREVSPYVETEHKMMCEKSDASAYEGTALSAALHDRFLCLLKKVSVRLIKGIALGAAFVVISFTAGWNGILPSFSMFFIGVFVFCCYFSLFFKIPIYLVDTVLRLCFLVITLPIFVICYPFPSTRGYTKKAWEMLLSILVHIISLCIFVALALTLIEESLK